MHTQAFPAALVGLSPAAAVQTIARSYRDALDPLFPQGTPPSFLPARRLVADIRGRTPDAHNAVKLCEHLATLHYAALMDARPVALRTALPSVMLGWLDDEPTPPASAFPALTVEETVAQGTFDARQVVLSPHASLGEMYAAEQALEAEIAKKRELLRCIRGMRFEKYGMGGVARGRLDDMGRAAA